MIYPKSACRNTVLDNDLNHKQLILNNFNLSGSNSPPLGAIDFAVFGFDTPLLAAGFFIFNFIIQACG